MGYLNRLQGRLLPHPNTRTIQEISEISLPGSDIPVQSTAIRSVHSTHGVYCSSKIGETDGHTQGYKDPPVPRLVGDSQIPSNLSPAYTGSSKNVSAIGLAGEFGEIIAGTQTSLGFYCINTSYPMDNCFIGRRDRSRQTPEKDILYILPAEPVTECAFARYFLPV